MFCTQCGKKLENPGRFCQYCGAQISAPAQPAAQPQQAFNQPPQQVTPLQSAAPVDPNEILYKGAAVWTSNGAKRNSSLLIINYNGLYFYKSGIGNNAVKNAQEGNYQLFIDSRSIVSIRMTGSFMGPTMEIVTASGEKYYIGSSFTLGQIHTATHRSVKYHNPVDTGNFR